MSKQTPERYESAARFYSESPTGQYDEEAAHALRCFHPLLEALTKINEWACFATEEDIAARLMALQQIGVLARGGISKALGERA